MASAQTNSLEDDFEILPEGSDMSSSFTEKDGVEAQEKSYNQPYQANNQPYQGNNPPYQGNNPPYQSERVMGKQKLIEMELAQNSGKEKLDGT
jgi:hypothetical protein